MTKNVYAKRCSRYSDGDKKAYSESSKWAIRQNKDLISQLRHENKLLRAKLSKKMMVSSIIILCLPPSVGLPIHPQPSCSILSLCSG